MAERPKLTATNLKQWHVGILKCLNRGIGTYFVSADIGAAVWPGQERRSASAAALGHLIQLEAAGFVVRGDAKTPIIWGLSNAGRQYLASLENSDEPHSR